MENQNPSIEEILNLEREMVLKGAERFGEYFENASGFNMLLKEFLISIDPDHFIFSAFLAQIRKHHTLALFSAVRLHHTQAMMNMRQVLEAGACAAYAIKSTETEDFADIDEQGILNPSDTLTKKRYVWLEENYKHGSDAIKNMKGLLNNISTHSNIVNAQLAFGLDSDSERFIAHYFDIEDEHYVKTGLWMIGNVVMGLMDLFYGINKDYDAMEFTDDYHLRLQILSEQNTKLKNEMMQTERIQRVERRQQDN